MSLREEFERKTAALVGRRIDAVEYWDIHLFGGERVWDHGDWHHAVMGVGLRTTTGPVSLLWTSTFSSYGVEVFDQPMSDFLVLGEHGPESWAVSEHPEWRSRVGRPVLAADAFWDRVTIGPARRRDRRIAGRARAVEVPVALRLDFDAGPVWFVAAVPGDDDCVVGGDEIVVVFSTDAMLRLGFPAGTFLMHATP